MLCTLVSWPYKGLMFSETPMWSNQGEHLREPILCFFSTFPE